MSSYFEGSELFMALFACYGLKSVFTFLFAAFICSIYNLYLQHLQSLQQALIPEIEERLRKKCETLVVAHDPQNSSTGTD